MDPSHQCLEVFTSGEPDRLVEIIRLGMSHNDMAEYVKRAVRHARAAKIQKSTEKSSSSLAASLESAGLPSVTYPANMDYDDMIGLIGEAVSEKFHNICSPYDLLYSKWSATGTSKSNGCDLLYCHNDRMISVECKHPHRSMMNNRHTDTVVVTKVNRGMQSHNDRRTDEFACKLFKRYIERRRLIHDSNSAEAHESDRIISLLENLVRTGGSISEIDVIVDERYEIDGGSVAGRLKFDGNYLPEESARALVVLCKGITDVSEEAYSGHE